MVIGDRIHRLLVTVVIIGTARDRPPARHKIGR